MRKIFVAVKTLANKLPLIEHLKCHAAMISPSVNGAATLEGKWSERYSMWMSVLDRLPELSHDEIVLWNGRWCRVGFYLGSLKYGPGFYSPHDERLNGVTHWMPLPEPPSE